MRGSREANRSSCFLAVEVFSGGYRGVSCGGWDRRIKNVCDWPKRTSTFQIKRDKVQWTRLIG